MVGSDIIKELLRQYPKATTRSIAKLAYESYPHLWKSYEGTRSSVRYIRGEIRHNKKAEFTRTKEEKKQAQGWRIPKSHANTYDDYRLPKACNRILLLSDIHIPYHDVRSLEAALQYGKDKRVNCIVLNGDIADCYQISRFVKDPSMIDIGTELEMTTDFLRMLKEEFQVPVYYKLGNHEERFQSYLKIKAPELLSIPEFRLDVLMKFGEIGIELVTDKRIIKAGDLSILHGHEFGSSVFSPVNPARGYYMRAKRSMIAGHNHQSSEHNEKDLSGKVTTCWSTGCLCELNPAYMPLNKWNHGFAYVKVNKDKSFEVDNLRILDGRIR